MCKAKICRELLGVGGDLALLQAFQQITDENYALSLSAGKSDLDQMSGTCLHRLSNLRTKADAYAFRCLLRYKLTVEPCGARCPDLLCQIHIGSHRKGDARTAPAICKLAQLDDSTAGRVTCRFDARKYHMMGAPIHAVQYGISAPL